MTFDGGDSIKFMTVSGATLTLQDLTVRNFYDGYGAITVSSGNLTLNNVAMEGNTASHWGGAVKVDGTSTLIVDNSSFRDNDGFEARRTPRTPHASKTTLLT